MPSPEQKREYAQALDVQRSRLARLAEGRDVESLRRLYDSALAELTLKLRRRAALGATFTAFQQQQLLAQVRQGQALMSQRLAGDLGDLSRRAQAASLRGLIDNFEQMEELFGGASIVLPIEESARFWGVVDRRRTSLLRQHETSMRRWGAAVVGDVEQQLALSLATGETTGAAIDRVERTADAKWYQAERIVRTEVAWASNAAHADGVREIARDVGDLYMRWTEHVSDSGVPMDDRVGADSVALHGQVARPGGVFTMPDDADGVSASLLGRSWSHPPSRPNDRAILTSWRPNWGGLAWTYRNGGRQFLSR